VEASAALLLTATAAKGGLPTTAEGALLPSTTKAGLATLSPSSAAATLLSSAKRTASTKCATLLLVTTSKCRLAAATTKCRLALVVAAAKGRATEGRHAARRPPTTWVSARAGAQHTPRALTQLKTVGLFTRTKLKQFHSERIGHQIGQVGPNTREWCAIRLCGGIPSF
jgi:hypothetical protein